MELMHKKEQLISVLAQMLNEKIDLLKSLNIAAIESRDSETKSSVGDKYETARAMADIEIQKNENQLNQLLKQRNELLKIDGLNKHDKAAYGSLIITSESNYFISVGLGKVYLKNELFMAISMASPIGNILKDKQPGDTFRFNGTDIKIEHIG